MDTEYGQIYEDLYLRHWWFRARESILVELIADLEIPRVARILDVGCGNGLFFEQLGRFGDVQGIEVDESLIPSESRHRGRIFGKPLGDSLYEGMQFDLITALDVVEHIEDDRHAIEAMLSMLRPGGTLVITVPALMMLWDRHDVINKHYRRYTAHSLRELLAGKGRVRDLRYLFHGLFFPKWAVKKLNEWIHLEAAQHRMPPPYVNKLMEIFCKYEHGVLRRFRLPFGTSLLAIVEKM
jgi:SAM-dependent methyltransferase